jgi:hypothetical protein
MNPPPVWMPLVPNSCHDGENHSPLDLREKGWPTAYLFNLHHRGGAELRLVGVFICSRCGQLYVQHPVTPPKE